MKKIIVQGILWDEKSSFLKGPAKAPPKIREVLYNGSSNLCGENGVSIKSDIIEDKGDFPISEYMEIFNISKVHLQDYNHLFTLGGDHSVTYPIVKAISEAKGPMHIIHIDAHADLYESFDGDKYSHACPFARICEEGLCSSLTQLGIRTLNEHQRNQAEKYEVNIINMKDYKDSIEFLFDGPVYISLDIDAFDPAFAPGVSHHEPGGFTSREVINIIQKINVPIIGADIVEYNPQRDFQDMTAALCAKMMKEILSKMIQ